MVNLVMDVLRRPCPVSSPRRLGRASQQRIASKSNGAGPCVNPACPDGARSACIEQAQRRDARA